MPPYPNLDHCHPHPKPHPHPPSPVSPRHQLAVTLTFLLGPIIAPLPPQIIKQKPSLLQFFDSSVATSASEREASSPSDAPVVIILTQRQPSKHFVLVTKRQFHSVIGIADRLSLLQYNYSALGTFKFLFYGRIPIDLPIRKHPDQFPSRW